MRAFWKRSSAGLRSLFIGCSLLLIAGVALSLATLASTDAGSAAFNTGFLVGRGLLLGAVGLGMMGLLSVLYKQRREGSSRR